VPAGPAPNGDACYECQPKSVSPCKDGEVPGMCPGSCDLEQQECVQDGYCHACKEKPKTQGCAEDQYRGLCPGSCLSQDRCVQDNENCYSCVPMVKTCEEMEMLSRETCAK